MADSTIEWSEALAVGVPSLDADHQNLFALTNGVLDAITEDRGAQVVATALDTLRAYCFHHFRREETLLREVGYPETDIHIAYHQRIAEKLEELRESLEIGGSVDKLARFLQSWILDHILVADMNYADYVRKIAPNDEDGRANKILVVEDSRFFASLLKHEIEKATALRVETVGTFAEAQLAVRARKRQFVGAVLDIVLPDATDETMAGLCREAKIPAVVFTSTYSEDLRERLNSVGVLDYIIKDNPSSVSQLVSLLNRLDKNRTTKALVVDDSSVARQYIAALLKQYNFLVLSARDGVEALSVLEAHPDIRLVISDYHMPNMNGIEMVRKMRVTHPKEKLAVIGLSSGGGTALSAQFIKSGANDFLAKPFLREEFFCRVNQNVDILDLFQTLRDASVKDFLTDLFNRRYFYEVGRTLFASMRRGKIALTAAVIDIDFFKRVNDTHGHEAGDAVLKAVAQRLRALTREADVLARIGGEEFAFLAVNVDAANVHVFFDRLRQSVADMVITLSGVGLSVTISIGVHHGEGVSLDEMMAKADEMLYRAKRDGRNRVEVDLGT